MEYALSTLDHVVSYAEQADIVTYYFKSDIFILPSMSEPWGLVVNEALLCGLPVIVSNKCGSAPELVKDGKNGFTFNPESRSELEDLMLGFIDNNYDIKSFGEESSKIIEEHSPYNVSLKIIDAFREHQILKD